ncbi:MAG: hypothetical protein KKC03_13060 [Bacteroidetes bacterium]|nr:hypothetical protein [Bacteroidota bacterium]
MKKNLSILKILDMQDTLASTWGIADRCSEIWKAKGLAKLIYVPSLISEILEFLFKLDDGVSGLLKTLGYEIVPGDQDNILSLLIQLDPKRKIIKNSKSFYSSIFEISSTPHGDLIGIMASEEKGFTDFYFSGNLEKIKEYLGQTFFWKEYKSICVSKSSNGFSITPLVSPLYIGTIGVSNYVTRYQKRLNSSFTLMIEGPSGSGKTILSHSIGVSIIPNGRVLDVTSIAKWSGLNSHEILELIKLCKPTVAIVNDIDWSKERLPENILDFLEKVRAAGTILILTYMTDTIPSLERGSLYVEGGRPGRIDEIIQLGYPDKNERELLLNSFCTKHHHKIDEDLIRELVLLTERTTGAFLEEIIIRAKAFGNNNIIEETNNLLLFAPPLN